MSENVLLVCSVGGTPAPLAGALEHWRPQRVLFVASPQTQPLVAEQIVPLAKAAGVDLPPGCYDCVVVPDSQDFSVCLGKLHDLDREVEKWLDRGADYAVVVDYTGGTKTMTAALVAHVRRWPCRLSYVGGAERTKGGVGVVVDGRETIVHAYNPWDSLGYQAVEDFVVLFDQHAYGPAAACLEAVIRRVTDAARKRELAALKSLAEAYAAWDIFQHKQALNSLRDVDRGRNDLGSVLPPQARDGLLATVRLHVERLEELKAPSGVGRATALDLLCNARRRAAEGRYDDAVARLYRAVEALAQDQLRREHGIADTGKVPLDRVPLSLRARYPADAADLKLGLQEAYLLLSELGDPLGQRFAELGWSDPKRSPLTARNQSILAHGFAPVGATIFNSLWRGCLALAGVDESGLTEFPALGGPKTFRAAGMGALAVRAPTAAPPPGR